MISKKYRTKINSFLEQYKSPILTIILSGIIGDILFLGQSQDLRIFSLIVIYILAIRFYKLKSRFTFSFALFVVIIIFIELILTSTSPTTEKAAIWLFFLIAIGIFQQIKE